MPETSAKTLSVRVRTGSECSTLLTTSPTSSVEALTVVPCGNLWWIILRRVSITSAKMSGERGQPCLMPARIKNFLPTALSCPMQHLPWS